MASIAQIRTGLATNLATISGLRTSAIVPDDFNPPLAVVIPSTIEYDTAFRRGLDTYEFQVLAIVARASERNAQANLDAYCQSTGSSSIKTALESNRTLSGVIKDLRVTQMRNYGPADIGGVTYLTAEFVVSVYSS